MGCLLELWGRPDRFGRIRISVINHIDERVPLASEVTAKVFLEDREYLLGVRRCWFRRREG